MLEWILIIAVLAAIFYAKNLPQLKEKFLDVSKVFIDQIKEKLNNKNNEKK